jgi:SNF2 family DNA or RNA helicase
MYTQQSAEEKILEIAKKKLVLDHLIVETMKKEESAAIDVEVSQNFPGFSHEEKLTIGWFSLF